MKIAINLASEPYQNLQPLRTALWVSALVALCLSLSVFWNYRQNRNETRLLSQRIGQLEREVAGLEQEQRDLEQWLRTPEVQRIRDASAFLNSLIARKSLSWTQIFIDLEKILPAQAQITAIRPSLNQSQRAELNLTVAAAEVGPLVELLKNLESSSQFGSPVVASQRFPTQRAAEGGIVVELATRYYPGAPDVSVSPAPEEGLQDEQSSDASAGTAGGVGL